MRCEPPCDPWSSARRSVSRELRLYLEDMLAACEKVLRLTRGLDLETLRADERTFDAVCWNLLVLGEAAKAVPDQMRAAHPAVEWRKVAGMRDVLAHGYFGVDDAIIWDVITNKVPPLARQLREILDSLPPTST